MKRRPPRSTRTDTLFPYTTLFRSLSAYLDGFEPVEPVLTARDGTLMARIEEAMGGLRAAIDDGTPADVVERQAQVIGSLLTDAEAALSPDRQAPHRLFSAPSQSFCARALKRC